MKKIISFTIPAIIFLAVVVGGCGVQSVNPPTASTGAGGGGPTTVQVTLSLSSIPTSGTSTVTATVTNALSQVMPNVSVSFSVISGTSGSFNPTPAITNASGQAVTTFTANAVNVNATIRATVTVGASTIIGNAPITIGVPPRIPTSVLVSLGTPTISNGGSDSVSATVSDAAGPIPGATVTFTVAPAAAGSFSLVTTTGACPGVTCGIATATFTANTPAGDDSIVTITATASPVSNSASLTVGTPPPPVPASMNLTINPLSITISAQATVTVTLRDASGNPAFNNGVTFLITGGTGTGSFNPMPSVVSSITATTNASGIASVTFYAGTTSGTVNIQATAGALTPKNGSLIITSNPDSISLSVGSSSLVNGQNTNVTADVMNVLGKGVSNGTPVTFTLTFAGLAPGALSSSTGFTVIDPISGHAFATVTFTADAVNTGTVFITASAGTAPVITSQNPQLITVSAASASTLEFISATPQVINILGAGTSSSTVIFKVLSSTGSPLANQSVDFTLFGPTGATLDIGGLTTSNGLTNALGLVTTTLNAGLVAGPVRIVATTTAPALTASSGAISIGGGLPSMRFFSLSVQKFNVPGLNCDGVTDQINVRLADRFGNYNIVQGTSVSFATAYGAIDTSNITDATGATSSLWHSQDPRPATGLVAILVQTTGEENFVDMNGNGVFDGGDTFIAGDPNYDLPEPFIDNNGNGTHDAGELFFNWPVGVTGNNATSYDGPNGVWDARIPIFNNVYIWMTGPPDVTSHIACCDPAVNPFCAPGAAVITPITIPAAGSTVCYLYSNDVNGNALIGGTKVSMKASTSDATITDYSGFTTFADRPAAGPEITGFLVTNTASAPPKTISLSATIDWTGACEGPLKVTISYPGVTLN